MAITLASVIAALDGLAGIVVGFLLIVLGMLAPTAQTSYIVFSSVQQLLEYFVDVVRFPALEAILVGLAIFVLGITDMYTGYQLWRQSKIVAVVSVIVAVAGGMIIGG